jgi:hypothetical protein
VSEVAMKLVFDLVVYLCSSLWDYCTERRNRDSADQMEGTAETELSTTVCASPVVSESGERR